MKKIRKLGRKPRGHDKRIPMMGALIKKHQIQLPPPPLKVDYTTGMSPDFGIMLNNQIGCCTCAAFYHARQIWSFNVLGKEITESDEDVLKLYEETCGYNPKDPTTDQGGMEQDVLKFLMTEGAPLGKYGNMREKIFAFLEVDFKNLDDVKRTIYECAICYIGIEVPQSVMDNADDPSLPWDTAGNQDIIGGHAVVLVGYDEDFFYCISWGEKYKITHSFMGKHLAEAYSIADPMWFMNTARTPLGLTLPQLKEEMDLLRMASA